MKYPISRVQMHGSTHLEGIGNVSACLPDRSKNIPMEIYYDTDFPNMILLKTDKALHFISLPNVQTGTFMKVKQPSVKS